MARTHNDLTAPPRVLRAAVKSFAPRVYPTALVRRIMPGAGRAGTARYCFFVGKGQRFDALFSGQAHGEVCRITQLATACGQPDVRDREEIAAASVEFSLRQGGYRRPPPSAG